MSDQIIDAVMARAVQADAAQAHTVSAWIVQQQQLWAGASQQGAGRVRTYCHRRADAMATLMGRTLTRIGATIG